MIAHKNFADCEGITGYNTETYKWSVFAAIKLIDKFTNDISNTSLVIKRCGLKIRLYI